MPLPLPHTTHHASHCRGNRSRGVNKTQPKVFRLGVNLTSTSAVPNFAQVYAWKRNSSRKLRKERQRRKKRESVAAARNRVSFYSHKASPNIYGACNKNNVAYGRAHRWFMRVRKGFKVLNASTTIAHMERQVYCDSDSKPVTTTGAVTKLAVSSHAQSRDSRPPSRVE